MKPVHLDDNASTPIAPEIVAAMRPDLEGRCQAVPVSTASRRRGDIRLSAALGAAVVLNGHPAHRLPNALNLSFVGRVGAEVLAQLPGAAASTGSACHAGEITLSSALAAMGVAPAIGGGVVRFSLGRGTTAEEIESVARQIARALA